MTVDKQNYDNVKQMTAMSLHKLIETTEQLTHLSLPERTALVEEISRVLPAGNIPSLVAAGLAKVPGRTVSSADNRRNLSLLLQGMQTFLDKAVFNTFYVGPATVLSAYQMLLKLAGKDIDQSFPEGTWQFYVEFGLREDSGRHACETIGFQEALEVEKLKLSVADEMTCWIAASGWLLDRYHVLLANEWMEQVRLKHIQSAIGDRRITDRWVKSRPYSVPPDMDIDFTDYRRTAFEAFCNGVLNDINPRLRTKIDESWNDPSATGVRAQAIAAYQRQMTILATLHPSEHSDSKTLLSRNQLSMAVVSNGRYYLADMAGMLSLDKLRPMCAAILQTKADIPTASLDKLLATARRRDQVALRKTMPDFLKAEIERLRHAPIIVNWDMVSANNNLLDIRSGRRGVGDHAMTIFRTNESMVFDLSHIFFDGPWGMAVAEILTGQAIRYARQLHKAPAAIDLPTLYCLDFEAPAGFAASARKVQLPPEVSGESSRADLNLLQQVRQSLRKRNNKVNLTVNDLLIMFRCIFNQIYQPSSQLMNALRDLAYSKDQKVSIAAQMALEALDESRNINPSLLIPIDASGVNPRERIFPTTFRNPFGDLLKQHRKAIAALDALESANIFGKPIAYRHFDDVRREYLMSINAFGQVIDKHKDVSLAGESVSTATLRLLGGLPQNVQRMLGSLPDTFDVINDVVKGQEVFSNVGRVSISSSLTRFNTAKDDNEKKVMAWGVLTDTKGVMHISLRDSRPHVAALFNAKQEQLAQQLTQEFVDAYAFKLNEFLEDLMRITRTRNE